MKQSKKTIIRECLNNLSDHNKDNQEYLAAINLITSLFGEMWGDIGTEKQTKNYDMQDRFFDKTEYTGVGV